MNKEIKFRAWDGKTFVPEHFFVRDGIAYCHEPVGDYSDNIAHEDWKLQQFTGLKDKNGKEIYEGDILERDFRMREDYKEDKLKGEVIWNDEFAGFALKRELGLGTEEDRIFYLNHTRDEIEKYEIIGNIYENEKLS